MLLILRAIGGALVETDALRKCGALSAWFDAQQGRTAARPQPLRQVQ